MGEHIPTWRREGLEIWATGPSRINLTTVGTVRICVVDDHSSESRFEERHAAMIAAAPDMLDALRELRKAFWADADILSAKEAEELVARVDAAIANAEGRS